MPLGVEAVNNQVVKFLIKDLILLSGILGVLNGQLTSTAQGAPEQLIEWPNETSQTYRLIKDFGLGWGDDTWPDGDQDSVRFCVLSYMCVSIPTPTHYSLHTESSPGRLAFSKFQWTTPDHLYRIELMMGPSQFTAKLYEWVD